MKGQLRRGRWRTAEGLQGTTRIPVECGPAEWKCSWAGGTVAPVGSERSQKGVIQKITWASTENQPKRNFSAMRIQSEKRIQSRRKAPTAEVRQNAIATARNWVKCCGAQTKKETADELVLVESGEACGAVACLQTS